jgi:hypothetical protein
MTLEQLQLLEQQIGQLDQELGACPRMSLRCAEFA